MTIKSYRILSLLFALLSLQSYSQNIKTTDYTVEIKKGKVIKENGEIHYEILTTLSNNSKDTLKYFSMSCSWQDFYSVDNKDLTVEVSLCDKNFPVVLFLPPNMSRREHLRLLIKQPKRDSRTTFKIGLNIMQAESSESKFDPSEETMKKNVIWSNTITM